MFAFQDIAGLVTDGQVWPQTAAALGISLEQPTIGEMPRNGGNATGVPFSIDTNLKMTLSPLTAAQIQSFANQTEGRDALKDIGDPVLEASAQV